MLTARWLLIAEILAGIVVGKLGLQFLEGLDFNLADPLPSQADLQTDFLEGERLLAFQSESQLENPGVAFVDRIQKLEDELEFLALLEGLHRGFRSIILEQVSKVESLAIFPGGDL